MYGFTVYLNFTNTIAMKIGWDTHKDAFHAILKVKDTFYD